MKLQPDSINYVINTNLWSDGWTILTKLCLQTGRTEEQQREVQGEKVMAEGHSRSKQGLEGECAGCIGSLPRRPTRVGGLGGLGGWSEEEKVWNAF